MSNLFEDVLNDSQNVQEKLLGPSYPYYKNIKTPSQIGMSDKGSLAALGKDIEGLVEYTSLLVSGKSKASATGKPLGNKFYLKTGGKCKDLSGNEQDRYIYINNVPSGNIPFISSGMGVNFSEFKGLIPGTMSNLNALNPYAIMGAFLTGSEPECQEITMEVIDISNNRSMGSNYVATVDINNMDPCWFSDKTNPISGAKCTETFTDFNNNKYNDNIIKSSVSMPDDLATQLQLLSVSLLGIYLVYCLYNKK